MDLISSKELSLPVLERLLPIGQSPQRLGEEMVSGTASDEGNIVMYRTYDI